MASESWVRAREGEQSCGAIKHVKSITDDERDEMWASQRHGLTRRMDDGRTDTDRHFVIHQLLRTTSVRAPYQHTLQLPCSPHTLLTLSTAQQTRAVFVRFSLAGVRVSTGD